MCLRAAEQECKFVDGEEEDPGMEKSAGWLDPLGGDPSDLMRVRE